MRKFALAILAACFAMSSSAFAASHAGAKDQMDKGKADKAAKKMDDKKK